MPPLDLCRLQRPCGRYGARQQDPLGPTVAAAFLIYPFRGAVADRGQPGRALTPLGPWQRAKGSRVRSSDGGMPRLLGGIFSLQAPLTSVPCSGYPCQQGRRVLYQKQQRIATINRSNLITDPPDFGSTCWSNVGLPCVAGGGLRRPSLAMARFTRHQAHGAAGWCVETDRKLVARSRRRNRVPYAEPIAVYCRGKSYKGLSAAVAPDRSQRAVTIAATLVPITTPCPPSQCDRAPPNPPDRTPPRVATGSVLASAFAQPYSVGPWACIPRVEFSR